MERRGQSRAGAAGAASVHRETAAEGAPFDRVTLRRATLRKNNRGPAEPAAEHHLCRALAYLSKTIELCTETPGIRRMTVVAESIPNHLETPEQKEAFTIWVLRYLEEDSSADEVGQLRECLRNSAAHR